ncbi:MAG: hypothetical protein RQ899_01485 [Pseudomonadales bacterium]|nr:hypothetical protein [Pseudomonadales bacterium]
MKVNIKIPTIILVLTMSSSAMSDNFGSIAADNKDHFICWNDDGFVPDELWAWWYGFGVLYSPQTGVDLIAWPCEPLVDVFFDDNHSIPNEWGRWMCTNVNLTTMKCIQGKVSQNSYKIEHEATVSPYFQNSTGAKYKNWCHEAGHSFGMQHVITGSCMVESMWTIPLNYSADELTHLTDDL